MSRVYASLPIGDPAGREVLRGAELALELSASPPELVLLDERVGVANARRAGDDELALAYLGDFHSSQVLASAPILGRAGLLAVAPVATYAGLSGPTLVRLMPHDGVGARAIAAWLIEQGVGELLVVHDHDEGYGVPVGHMCAAAARERGMAVTSRPVWGHDETPAIGGARAVLYVGVAGSGAAAMWRELHALDPEVWLLGTEGVAVDWLARELEPGAAERTRFFLAQRAPWGFYGFEAMALILDAIERAGPDREAVARSARATRDRDSILGRYSIDTDGIRPARRTGGSPLSAASWCGTAGSIKRAVQPDIQVSDDPAGTAAELLAGVTGQLCITGGSTPRAAYERIAELRADGVWFTDERCVPPDHEHSNFRMANEALLERAGGATVHRMKGELGPVEGAADYEREYELAGEPSFDLILLGLGPDAHTCSLFPGDEALGERERPVVGVETPGMAPLVSRVTLTLPVVNGSRRIVFLVTGEDKAEAVARAFAGSPDPSAPASLVDGEVTVLLDEAAARRL